MTVREVAVYLQISDSTVYKLVRSNRLPGRKVGNKWRFSRSAVENWLIVSDNELGKKNAQSENYS
jgi:excisionase family DNA binding protein